MEQDVLKTFQLATGSFPAGSGRGCVMNVISWENGDTTITDHPTCADKMLTEMMIEINDGICPHTHDGYMCHTCSEKVLALGHRTHGTNLEKDASIVHAKVLVKVTDKYVKALKRKDEREAAKSVIDAVMGMSDDRVGVEKLIWDVKFKMHHQDRDPSLAWETFEELVLDGLQNLKYGSSGAYQQLLHLEGLGGGGAYIDRVLSKAHSIVDAFDEVTGYKACVPPKSKVREVLKKMLKRTEPVIPPW